MYVTWLSLKEMRKLLIIQYIKYIAYHFLIIIITAAGTLTLWLTFSGIEITLFNKFLTINLIVFIAGFVVYVTSKTHIAENIIQCYRKFQFNHSKRAVIKKAKKFELDEINIEMIKSLEYEDNEDTLNMLLRIMRDRENAKKSIEDLKTLLIRKKIDVIEKILEKLKKEPRTTNNIRSIKEYEKMLKMYKEMIETKEKKQRSIK
jgi:ABC-type multidrug transport system fused ATPase/permease subunit